MTNDDTSKRLDDLKTIILNIDKRLTVLEQHQENAVLKDKDVLFAEAVKLIKGKDMISVSFLQRRLSIGYARAARLMDQLEDAECVQATEDRSLRKVITSA